MLTSNLTESLRNGFFFFFFFFFFFLYGAAAHIGPWPPLYEVP
jgi:hypothetical protein